MVENQSLQSFNCAAANLFAKEGSNFFGPLMSFISCQESGASKRRVSNGVSGSELVCLFCPFEVGSPRFGNPTVYFLSKQAQQIFTCKSADVLTVLSHLLFSRLSLRSWEPASTPRTRKKSKYLKSD